MGRKSNRNKGNYSAPNAPEFHQILQQQPATNPYYPDTSGAALLTTSVQPPPPPYNQLSTPISSASHRHQQQAVPMAQLGAGSQISYPRYDGPATQTHIDISAPRNLRYDRRAEYHSTIVRSFNNSTILKSIVSICLTIWAFKLFDDRNCLFDFVVHKPDKDLKITISNVRQMHLSVAYISGLVLLSCLVKSATGFYSKSYSCYLFLISLISLSATFLTGYLAYLAFYSPCTAKPTEVLSNAGRTLLSEIIDKLPSPDKGYFGEKTVLDMSQSDPNGLFIFVLDVINFLMFLSTFLRAVYLC